VISNNLTLRVHEIDEKTIVQVFSELATIHFCLRGLRITDIPMKDSSADSRAIYEVLLLHPANDHVSQRSFEEYYNQHNSIEGVNEDEYEEEILVSSTPLDNRSLSGGSTLRCSASSVALTLKKDYLGLGRTNQLMENSMIALRWKSTDRRVDVNSLSCSCIHRVTPVNPASSPSQCLMKHMGSGKSVILQLLTTPGSGGGEPSGLLTHVLLNHGGEVYIHCLHQTPSVLDLPLSFYSKKGPSVRVRDFTTLMGITTIFPSPNPPTNSSHSSSKSSRDTHGVYQLSYVEQTEEPQQPGESPIRTPKYTTTKALERLTRYFPLLEGNTVLMDPEVSDDGKRLLDPLKTYLFRDEPDPDADADAIEVSQSFYSTLNSYLPPS
jgi:hypothetical protein